MNYLTRLAQLTGIVPTQERSPGAERGQHFPAADISREDVVMIDALHTDHDQPPVGRTDSLERQSTSKQDVLSAGPKQDPIAPEEKTVTLSVLEMEAENRALERTLSAGPEHTIARRPIPKESRQNERAPEAPYNMDVPAEPREPGKSGGMPEPGVTSLDLPRDPIGQQEVHVQASPVQETLEVITIPGKARAGADAEGQWDNRDQVVKTLSQDTTPASSQDINRDARPTLFEVRQWVAQGTDAQDTDGLSVMRPDTDVRITRARQDQGQSPQGPSPEETGLQSEAASVNDYHLSIESINLIVETPAKESPVPLTRPAPKDPTVHDPGARLGRHYIRTR